MSTYLWFFPLLLPMGLTILLFGLMIECCGKSLRRREALKPFAALGGDDAMPAFHDLEDDVVIYENSGRCITAGDVRAARELIR